MLSVLPPSNVKNAKSQARETRRPNFLIIISDDQRHDTMEFMPRTKGRLIDQGVLFTHGYVTTPLCCPSRASILTGMYAHNHGVRVNEDPLRFKTFVDHLHENGYYTGLVGKYLNSWDGSPRPEFDFWASHAGGSVSYTDPRLNINGTWRKQSGYVTHIFRDQALEFLSHSAQQTKPFALVFAPNAPHQPATPAPGDETLYPDLPPNRPPNFNEEDVADKPLWLQTLFSPLTPVRIETIEALRGNQIRSLNALDQAVDTLLTLLNQQGRLNTTMVIYISDNGYFWGEHRLTEKLRVYESASRVPFMLYHPPLVRGPVVEERLVANIDLAPTIYELAGLPIPPEVDGRSLVPLLQGKNVWRNELLIEGWSQNLPIPPYFAIHTGQFVYVENKGDRAELYDLTSDPYELENQINNSSYGTIIDTLKKHLQLISLVKDTLPASPKGFSLYQNYPNPVRLSDHAPATIIRFSLPQRSHVRLRLYDTLGRQVATLLEKELPAGEHGVVVNKVEFASGVYFYRIEAGSLKQERRILVIK
ncbi:MAG: sulfatase-like hydrolase/transferase [candidate division KSB1 bacterium]|nr:sulfatase-like hydrolase/transferase [candidate division KSB1 bacterium]MDZ7301493.1 sulfatase-like hydrolase/transferase [candidate division KSB1 bacterium]MDZ7310895.1 sulfatase-like hydrolase/transferase [candidate division KSB1 bacterium]